jgi:putative pyrroloquinoline-quinone-binding quinoprotein
MSQASEDQVIASPSPRRDITAGIDIDPTSSDDVHSPFHTEHPQRHSSTSISWLAIADSNSLICSLHRRWPGDVVIIGVLNGTLEARDVKTGELLWDYQVEKSKENKAWVLASDRKMNGPLLFYSNWREIPIVAADQSFGIGAIFSSPLVANGAVYFGSTDGFLYALE